MFLSLEQPRPVAYALPMVSSLGESEETRLRGQALKALRQRAGMTLAEAGDAVEPEGMSGQAWGLYERGDRPGIHRPDNLDRLLKAVSADREDFRREVERLSGGAGVAEAPALLPPTPPPAAHAVRALTVPVIGRARRDPDRGALVYDARQSDSVQDMSWLFGSSAGHLRMADDRLKGRVEAGQLLHYDRNLPPRSGQVCVVEVATGLYVYEYRELTGATLTVAQANPQREVQFDMDQDQVRGVYAVRLIGD